MSKDAKEDAHFEVIEFSSIRNKDRGCVLVNML